MKNSNVVSIILLVIAIVAAAFIIGSDGINNRFHDRKRWDQ